MTRRSPPLNALPLTVSGLLRGGAMTAALLCGTAGAALPETRPSLNFYGATGLIDMPSGESQPDGQFSVSVGHFGPITRTTLSFQITPRISASFRFLGIAKWNAQIPPADRVGTNAFDTYYDRSFDLRFRVLDESRYLPSVTIGLQDFAGTGVLAGEYVAATKHVTPSVKVTAGLGWGRLGSNGSIGSVFGDRPVATVGQGGRPNWDQWFRGPAAPFAGVEWQINPSWTFKAEYSSDAYEEEAGRRGTFDRKSDYNFGVEYQKSDSFRVGAYYLYGSRVGLAGHIMLNPRKSAAIDEPAPAPVRPRPPRSDVAAWSGDWVTQADAGGILRGNIARRLEDDGILVESLGYSAGVAQLRIRNTRLMSEAQAVGRAARVLSQTLPASVERFEIVPMVNGLPTAAAVMNRADLEALEFSPDATARMQDRVAITDVAGDAPGMVARDPDLYPRLTWSLGPYGRLGLFDPDGPIRADAGLRLSGRYDLAPGWVLSGSVTQKVVGNLDDYDRPSNSVLPRVRTEGYLYDRNDGPALENLTLAWYGKPGRDIYTRVTGGYLERMFGGVSAEVLWKPAGSALALGAEVNYARHRDFDQRFGFQDYSIVTGHLSAYYEFGNGYLGQVDVGRYLAGDIGATVSLDREFANGWRVGAFATKTDVSSADFGEGSFDKGIRVVIPLGTALGTQTKSSYRTTLRPITRDGGARLNVDGRLYETVRETHGGRLDAQFGRFWK
ncbi:YjbH domain-containing protein [Szabonella alba]|uniref:YjbH domain-containing protein n=1 Tax=Szabonella alba TaxID=2804194 RepID=A0A8K0Y165_9RHOB|nr:YjbH domain-containing protein [Szabonella alba]MBL4915694.1 YjbH domain-containing protein [Szabonella alba]